MLRPSMTKRKANCPQRSGPVSGLTLSY